MAEYRIDTGFIPEDSSGFVVVHPLPEQRVTEELMSRLTQPPDNQRDYGFRWTESAMEVQVTPVIIEEMYIFRNYVAGLLEGHEVTVSREIDRVEPGGNLLPRHSDTEE